MGRLRAALGIRLVDVGATVIVAVVVELNVATGGGAGSHPLNALAYVLGGILPIPVLFRRKWPLPVLIACSVLLFIYYVDGFRRNISPAPLLSLPLYDAALAGYLTVTIVIPVFYLAGALRAGASGFLVKDLEPADLLQAIRVVARGDALIAPSVTRALIGAFTAATAGPAAPAATAPPAAQSAAIASLTDREREIVSLVAAGLSNDEIAERLVVSPLTAKTHVSRAMIKLAARDRAQLVVIAYQNGLAAPGMR